MNVKWYENKTVIILSLIFFFPLGLFLMWKYSNWSTTAKGVISAVIALIVLCGIFYEEPSNEFDDSSLTTTSTTVSEKSVLTSSTTSTTEPTTILTTTSTTTSNESKSASSSKKTTTTTKTTTTKSKENSQGNGKTIYATPSGARYHYDPDCGGVNSKKISWDKVSSRGLSPCQKCAS